MTTSEPRFYVTGGTVPRDAPSYVYRQADDELLAALRTGTFCYVLTPRQMGKSSLMVRAASRLREAGVAVAVVDLTAFGQNLSAEQWYRGLLCRIGRNLGIEEAVEAFWRSNEELSPLQRWSAALERVVLQRCGGPVVIFVDEIDAVRSLRFPTDELFAAIRELYNRRTEQPGLGRLSFCLLGVAAPSDLIADIRVTPFNVGQRIELRDFMPDEAAPLAAGLGRDERTNVALLQRVMYWTGGHPYLTQRLCQAVAKDLHVSNAAGVDRLCLSLFLAPGAEERDDNLLFVRDRLLRGSGDPAGPLDLYGRVLRGRTVPDDDTVPLIGALRLSGVVRSAGARLRVRNRIYERVFGRAWVADHLPGAEVRRQRAAYGRGLARASMVAAAIVALMLGLALTAWHEAHDAWEASAETNRTAAQLRRARDRADQEAARADGEREVARRALRQAETEAANALGAQASEARHRRLAEERGAEAERQQKRATEMLWRSCISQAVADRWSLRPGGRHDSLAALRVAARIHPTLEVRNEVIACLARADVRKGRTWEALPGDSVAVWFDPAFQHYARGDRRGGIEIHRLSDNACVRRLQGPRWPVGVALFSPDGRFLATKYDTGAWGTTNEMIVWEWRRGRACARLPRGIDGWAVCFSPDSRRVAVGQLDGTVGIVDLAAGQVTARLPVSSDITSVCFHPDGQRLGVAARGAVQVWDIRHGALLAALPNSANSQDLAWYPDGRRLAVAGVTSIAIWDVPSLSEVACMTVGAQGIRIALGREGGTLASTAWDGITRLWDATSGQVMARYLGGAAGNLAFGPGDATLASFRTGSRAGLLKLDDRCGFRSLRGQPDSPRSALSRDGQLLVSYDAVGVYVRTAADGRLAARLPLGGCTSVLYEPADRALITSGRFGILRWPVHVVRGGAARAIRMGPAERVGSAKLDVQGASLSADGQTFAFVEADRPRDRGTVHVWPEGMNPLKEVRSQPMEYVDGVTISPDGRWLACGYWPTPGCLVLDSRTCRPVRPALPAAGNALAAFSPDSQHLILAARGEYVSWRVGSWQQEWRIARERSPLAPPIAFAPDGGVLARALDARSVQLVDCAAGRELATLYAPDPLPVAWLQFSPDGSTLLAVVGIEGLIQLWDLRAIRRELAARGLDWRLPPYPPAPRHEAVRVFVIGVPQEAEESDIVEASGCAPEPRPAPKQLLGRLSGDALLTAPGKPGSFVTIAVDIAIAGRYRLTAQMMRAADHGQVDAWLDDRPVGKAFDGYSTVPTGPCDLDLGEARLSEGRHLLRFRVAGKSPVSSGYGLSVDCLRLDPVF